MHANAQLIQRFYDRFAHRDAEGMNACYAADVCFTDPVFQNLKAAEARAMWRMLARRATDLKIRCSNIAADADSGSADWEAEYTFSGSGRPVHNRIHASFEFANGLIVSHRDDFDLWRWSGMALGLAGRLFGWLPAFQARLRDKARAGLDAFMRGEKS